MMHDFQKRTVLNLHKVKPIQTRPLRSYCAGKKFSQPLETSTYHEVVHRSLHEVFLVKKPTIKGGRNVDLSK